MAPGDTARMYHRLTSYSPEREFPDPADDPRIVRDFVSRDWDAFPRACKAYDAGLPVAELPREWAPWPGLGTRCAAARCAR